MLNSQLVCLQNILCLHAGKVAGGIYHANEVDPQIIMAQAPMTHTLNAFWQLIIKERVDMVSRSRPCRQFVIRTTKRSNKTMLTLVSM